MAEYKKYKGYIMFLGIFRIRKDFCFYHESDVSPHGAQLRWWENLEPILRKFCTIKWIEMSENDTEIAYYPARYR